MTRQRGPAAGRAVLVVVGAIDDDAAEDVRAKFEVLCAYPHVECVEVDLRAAFADDRLAAVVAALRRQARSHGTLVAVRGAGRLLPEGAAGAPLQAGA